MIENIYDIIVIGAGSGGLSVGLTMNKLGFKVLMIAKTDKEIGGDCLNDGCVPSKALIHVARIAHAAKTASHFGLEVNGKIDIKKAIEYVYSRQEIIREHEDAKALRNQGINVALGKAKFVSDKQVDVEGIVYEGKKIVIATGSFPVKLKIPGKELVKYYDNKSIFHIDDLPDRLLVIGGGPIGIEMAQAFSRLGTKVSVVHNQRMILQHDETSVAEVLYKNLQHEGIEFYMEAITELFSSANEAVLKLKNGDTKNVAFDAVFVGIGRKLFLDTLQLSNAGIEVKDKKIVRDKYLRTTNKNVFVCGDIAGDLMFSHAAEFHARLLLNNFFSPIKKKLNNDHMSWVTFTDPELATFGLNEKQIKDRGINYEKLEQDFIGDDRAITDNYQYAKIILYISKGSLLKKEKILGGTMIAPNAGELIQELILANTLGLSISSIFNKIYPYPVATRVNQQLIVKHKQKSLTSGLKKLLQVAFKIFG
jgi:pyruvate/2-oxoglutarate dehydrogenase complex dihydrolipoamide dehydrogenase (E3) component